MKSHNQLGFTLIELLVVIAILSILASIALPSYQHYTKKARFSEVIMAAAPYKTAVTIALQSGDAMDELQTGTHGIPESVKPTKNVESIEVENGVITATATEAAGEYTYILTPNENATDWQVGGTCVNAGLCQS